MDTKVPPKSRAAWMCGSSGDGNESDGFGRFGRVLPHPSAVRWASVVRIRSLSAAHAVRVILGEFLRQAVAARETLDAVLQEMATEKHVYPRVAAAVQGSQQRRDRDGRVFRIGPDEILIPD